MYNPKISIIIPVYNGVNFMREAIDSALEQTYKNIEIIVVNDGSKDNGETDRIARSYGDKIRYFCKENGGSSSALNYGIKKMTGDYFSWLSHDDVYEKNRTEEMVKKIDISRKDKQIVMCGFKLIDKDSKQIPYPKKQMVGELNSTDMFRSFQKGFNINGCAVLVPQKAIEEAGLFDENLRYVNDTDYWYRLILNGCEFTCFDTQLVCSRVHSNQVTVTDSELFKKEIKILSVKVLKKLVKNPEDNSEKINGFIKYSSKNGSVKAPCDAVRAFPMSIFRRMFLYINIYVYFIYGRVLVFLKSIYKKIFFKR